MTLARVTARVPAKINLSLSVGPLRPDGFHELVTLYQAIALFDDVTVTLKPKDERSTVEVSGEYASSVPLDESNLAYRAAMRVLEAYENDSAFAISIRKSIPVAAGLAGGSADAAGALLAMDTLLGGQLGKNELHLLAAELGSDVPFALIGNIALGRGRGEEITPALSRGEFHWVLGISNQGLSTPAVYKESDRLREGMIVSSPRISEKLMHALLSGEPEELGKNLSNDLAPAALSLRPGLRLVLDIAAEYAALGAIVSGSGPTIAILARDEEHSLDIAVALTASGVVNNVARALGPVAGARIIESK
ncbi:MAG: 4-(cytidine 5'-diphospho)-2-C-methyl-D-erythritol kinase [Actinobacteria bacterium]|uniref:4-(cytidine 5'-diphospho)-2-C-methyl-D-erythritol kinase n=1 Tax=freshwater metagenome TaxID=449393 RepID=A0A6J7RY48_9ZZZZ|nr:4-(cytidine 5'-diphospho)-2-C-methyl-D-erythritol kinase [Actinomycetota bacterium]MSY26851.1 4-(cytidine 5'-diphospho)-2-C-methyl-D-erythritol kinase [Actinomycetota bacterium]MSZ86584.1 4-(cytidine 5'-diphospho)-2-C-methyl-D-erythritol kinase [Actinomycetota bacterium]MTB14015.1 4-(cytidine 5'-diphospho)-2-C-methyl-D-erythritol kinase [Actinomycetota bacterium]MTB24370.1 4-(cytidine 5'-diphospho)-2-C-methyl-D-erythritol kinase [Actinomycetota bacterium]